jgi:hypothetical protein
MRRRVATVATHLHAKQSGQGSHTHPRTHTHTHTHTHIHTHIHTHTRIKHKTDLVAHGHIAEEGVHEVALGVVLQQPVLQRRRAHLPKQHAKNKKTKKNKKKKQKKTEKPKKTKNKNVWDGGVCGMWDGACGMWMQGPSANKANKQTVVDGVCGMWMKGVGWGVQEIIAAI